MGNRISSAWLSVNSSWKPVCRLNPNNDQISVTIIFIPIIATLNVQLWENRENRFCFLQNIKGFCRLAVIHQFACISLLVLSKTGKTMIILHIVYSVTVCRQQVFLDRASVLLQALTGWLWQVGLLTTRDVYILHFAIQF